MGRMPKIAHQLLTMFASIKLFLMAMLVLSPIFTWGEEYSIDPEDPMVIANASRLERIIKCLAKHESIDLLLGAGSDQGDGWWSYLVLPDRNNTLDYRYVRFVSIRYDKEGTVIAIESTGGEKGGRLGPKQRVSDKVFSELAKSPDVVEAGGGAGQRESHEKTTTPSPSRAQSGDRGSAAGK